MRSLHEIHEVGRLHRLAGVGRWGCLLWLGWLLGAAGGRAQAPTWIWSSPQPHGNNIYDLAESPGGQFVQVGDRGQCYTSLDLELWLPQDTRTTNALRGIAFLGQRLVLTGEAGTVAYADLQGGTNLSAFTTVSLGTTNWLEGVASSGSRLVAVGDNGALYTSTDGASWTPRSLGTTTWLRSVAYGNGTFVAVGEGGLVATSNDGSTWRARTSGVATDLNRVAWLTNRFAIVGDAGVVLIGNNTGTAWNRLSGSGAPTNDLYTVSGTISSTLAGSTLLVGGVGTARMVENLSGLVWVWTDETRSGKSAPAPSWTYYSSLHSGGLFLLGGNAGMFAEGYRANVLADYAWLSPSDPVRHWLWDLAYWPGLYVAVGDFGTIQTSARGVEWDLELVPASATNSVLLGVGGRADLFVAVGTQGTVLTSSNSVAWTAVTPRPAEQDLQGVAVYRNRVYVTGGNGAILTTSDGVQWTSEPSPTTAFLSSVAAFPGGLIACGEGGKVVFRFETDLWAVVPVGTTNWLYRVRYLEGQLVMVGEKGSLYTSPDGVTWTARSSGTTSWLTDATYLDGRFYVVGTQGTVLSSPDLAQWTSARCLTQKSLYAAVSHAHQLVAVGVEGVIVRGQPAPLNLLGYSHTQGTNVVLVSGRIGSRFTLDRSADLTAWEASPELRFLDNTGSLIFEEAPTNAAPRRFYRPSPQP